jgi:hypothetical protein
MFEDRRIIMDPSPTSRTCWLLADVIGYRHQNRVAVKLRSLANKTCITELPLLTTGIQRFEIFNLGRARIRA